MPAEPTVFVIDDDAAVRRFLSGLIRSIELPVKTFASARNFLDFLEPNMRGCIVLDIRMPGMGGLELQQELARRTVVLPVIFLTAHGDVQVAVRAMKAGAFDFIEKPFSNELLLNCIQKAMAEGLHAASTHDKRQEVARRKETLTPREHEVMQILLTGATNKGIARQLDISDKTVEIHRANVMHKMGVKSLAELVKLIG